MTKQHNVQWRYRGRRGFVIGGGASIRQLMNNSFNFQDLVKQEVVVGVNKAYRLCKPQLFGSIDIHFLRDAANDLTVMKETVKFIPDICMEYYDKDDPEIISVSDTCTYRRRSHERVTLPPTLNQFCYVGGSGLFGLKIAYLAGLNPIYLLGFDCKQVEGKSHFHDEYGEVYSDNHLKQFSMNVIKFVENLWFQKKVEVYSCSPDSLLHPHVKYRDLDEVIHSVS